LIYKTSLATKGPRDVHRWLPNGPANGSSQCQGQV